MPVFCGQQFSILETTLRLRFNRKYVEEFLRRDSSGEVVLYGLPEGALALYPQDVYDEMRAKELGDLSALGGSFNARRSLRRFGALTEVCTLTPQGRITIPESFCRYAGLTPGEKVCVVGVEVGLEIWEPSRFETEMNVATEQLEKQRRLELYGNAAADEK